MLRFLAVKAPAWKIDPVTSQKRTQRSIRCSAIFPHVISFLLLSFVASVHSVAGHSSIYRSTDVPVNYCWFHEDILYQGMKILSGVRFVLVKAEELQY